MAGYLRKVEGQRECKRKQRGVCRMVEEVEGHLQQEISGSAGKDPGKAGVMSYVSVENARITSKIRETNCLAPP
jgi:hypothetical protein